MPSLVAAGTSALVMLFFTDVLAFLPNAFIEPQFSVADKGPGQPEWQVFVGFNMQFRP